MCMLRMPARELRRETRDESSASCVGTAGLNLSPQPLWCEKARPGTTGVGQLSPRCPLLAQGEGQLISWVRELKPLEGVSHTLHGTSMTDRSFPGLDIMWCPGGAGQLCFVAVCLIKGDASEQRPRPVSGMVSMAHPSWMQQSAGMRCLQPLEDLQGQGA